MNAALKKQNKNKNKTKSLKHLVVLEVKPYLMSWLILI